MQVLAAEERAHLLADQLEEERQLHAQVLESREGELTARWERALEAAQGDRSTLQQALELANRQLHAAHRDMETLRLQVQHLRLGAPASTAAAPAAVAAGHNTAAAGPGSSALASPGYAGSSYSGAGGAGGFGAAAGGSGRLQVAVGGGGSTAGEEQEGSVPETASPSGSRDVFSELPDAYHTARSHHSQEQPQHQSSSSNAGSGPGASAYQLQLHRHIDTLAGKLSTFQRVVEEARQVGHQASQQVGAGESGYVKAQRPAALHVHLIAM